ncbi:DNA repair protein RecO [Candidatus Peregrinibacteria bacterium]|nr:DNA repair protein RecO [Candidatus Peregrinibacteria bacterium]
MFKKHLRTEGIILRKLSLNEGDIIVTLLTKEHGKIDCIAKSARRIKSRFLGRLELFNRIDATLFSGRNLDVINEIETVGSQNFAAATVGTRHGASTGTPDNATHFLPNCAAAFFITEITHRLLQPGQHIAGAYPLFLEALSLLGRRPNAEGLMTGYLIQLFGLLGHMPSWRICAVCGESLDLQTPLTLAHEGLAVCCAKCSKNSAGFALGKTDEVLLKIVHFLQTHTLKEACQLNLSKEKETLWQWIQNVLRALLPYAIKSGSFAEEVMKSY